MIEIAELIVNENVFVVVCVSAPVTRTSNVVVPEAVVVPLNTPADDNVIPDGNVLPETKAHVYGVVDPDAAKVWL